MSTRLTETPQQSQYQIAKLLNQYLAGDVKFTLPPFATSLVVMVEKDFVMVTFNRPMIEESSANFKNKTSFRYCYIYKLVEGRFTVHHSSHEKIDESKWVQPKYRKECGHS